MQRATYTTQHSYNAACDVERTTCNVQSAAPNMRCSHYCATRNMRMGQKRQMQQRDAQRMQHAMARNEFNTQWPHPSLVFAFTSAPCLTRSLATGNNPVPAASWRGVLLQWQSIRRGFSSWRASSRCVRALCGHAHTITGKAYNDSGLPEPILLVNVGTAGDQLLSGQAPDQENERQAAGRRSAGAPRRPPDLRALQLESARRPRAPPSRARRGPTWFRLPPGLRATFLSRRVRRGTAARLALPCRPSGALSMSGGGPSFLQRPSSGSSMGDLQSRQGPTPTSAGSRSRVQVDLQKID